MTNSSKSYPLPTETLPTVELTHNLRDLEEIQTVCKDLGIRTENTRIDRYLRFLREALNTGHRFVNYSTLFKNSDDIRFRTPEDWFLYILREVHELSWIFKGLQIHKPVGFDDKLKKIVGGSDFAALDRDSESRNAQFELRIASYFCQSGFDVNMDTATDILAKNNKFCFYIECKRISSNTQLKKRLSEARRQLRKRMPRKDGKQVVLGCIAVDVTQIAFSQNGLTIGLTNDHSRDLIQDKLKTIAFDSDKHLSFDSCRKLMCYWLQVHIPSLIINPAPATPATRFSSIHVTSPEMRKKELKAVRFFFNAIYSTSAYDKRTEPTSKLKLREMLSFPKGSAFFLDEKKLKTLLSCQRIPEEKKPEVIGKVAFENLTDDFSEFEVHTLAPQDIEDWKSLVDKDPVYANTTLLAKMYLRRYPYEGSPRHLAKPIPEDLFS